MAYFWSNHSSLRDSAHQSQSPVIFGPALFKGEVGVGRGVPLESPAECPALPSLSMGMISFWSLVTLKARYYL